MLRLQIRTLTPDGGIMSRNRSHQRQRPAQSSNFTFSSSDYGGDLLKQCQEGDESKFTILVNTYSNLLFHVARRMIGNTDRVDDVVQETWLQIWKHRNNFIVGRKFVPWACFILRNKAKNELRERNRCMFRNPEREHQITRAELTAKIQFPSLTQTIHHSSAQEEEKLQNAILSAANDLTPSHRDVLFLRDVGGLEYEEIAQIVGVNVGTVKSRLNRARTLIVSSSLSNAI